MHILAPILLAVWAALYVWSFIAFAITEPTDFGFTRGMNRISLFFGWQFAAGLAAIVVFAMSWQFPPRTLRRWVYRLPLFLGVTLLAALLAVAGWAAWSKPPQPSATETPPVTVPVTPN